MSSRLRPILVSIAVVAALLCCGCGKRVDEGNLYGVWLGNNPKVGRVLMTFIVKGKLELEYPDGAKKINKVGKWTIKDNSVLVEVEGEPSLTMTLDSVEQNGDDHDRLTDKATGIWVAKV